MHVPSTVVQTKMVDVESTELKSERRPSFGVVQRIDGIDGPVIPHSATRGSPINFLLVVTCIAFGCSSFLTGMDDKIISPLVALEPFVGCILPLCHLIRADIDMSGTKISRSQSKHREVCFHGSKSRFTLLCSSRRFNPWCSDCANTQLPPWTKMASCRGVHMFHWWCFLATVRSKYCGLCLWKIHQRSRFWGGFSYSPTLPRRSRTYSNAGPGCFLHEYLITHRRGCSNSRGLCYSQDRRTPFFQDSSSRAVRHASHTNSTDGLLARKPTMACRQEPYSRGTE